MVAATLSARSAAAAAAARVPTVVGKQSEARQNWTRTSTIVALTALAAAAITATVAAWAARRRRRARGLGGDEALETDDAASSGAATPTGGLGDRPQAGPGEVGAEYLAAEEQRAERQAALDEGLRALGMLPSVGHTTDGAAERQRQPRAGGAHAYAHPEGDVEGAEDYVVVERVSQEEEERRYFANMTGGSDLFGGVEEADPPQRRRPVIAYD